LRLASPHRLLGTLEPGDVDEDAHPAGRFARGVADRGTPGEHRAVGAVPVAEADFRLELGALAGQVPAHRLLDAGAVVRVGHGESVPAAAGGPRVAELLPDVDVVAAAAAGIAVGRLGLPDADVGPADRQFHALVGPAECLGLLRLPPLGHVAEHQD